jgi:hypothetical protein
MRLRRTETQTPASNFVEQARALTKPEIDKLRQRVNSRFERRKEDRHRAAIEILALQLEFEAAQLTAWRNGVTKLRRTNFVVDSALTPVPTGAVSAHEARSS